MAASAPPARPPAHYRVLPVAREQILLQLTVSNRCGQAFRWRANEVWEYIGDEELGPPLKSEPETPVKREPDAETAHVKSETDGSAAHVKAENGSAHASTSLKGWEQQTEWSLCLSDRVVLLRQDEARGYLYFRTLLPSGTDTADVELVESQTRSWLHDYLNLSVPLEALYKEWSLKDPVFRRFATRFAGVRMLQQEPWECLCAFICSSNNNIARIGQMVQALCTHYSEPLLEYSYPAPPDALLAASPDLKSGPTRIVYHPFPSAATLAQPGVEETLKQLSFGYRAKYIAATARALCEAHPHAQRQVSPPLALKPEPALLEAEAEPRRGKRARQEAKLSSAEMKDNKTSQETKAEPEAPPPSIHSPASYLLTLRDMPYHEARAELLKLSGVGPKVADCILLMSLNQPSSIPVDRHVYQFAARWYGMKVKEGARGYETLAERFRELWGEYAGWAHSVLFTADLRAFAGYEPKKEEPQEDVQTKLEDGAAVKMEAEPAGEEGPGTPLLAPPAAPGALALGTMERPPKRKRGGRS